MSTCKITRVPANKETVNHPSHYQSSNGIECIQAIEAATENKTGMVAVCTANIIKYLWRCENKGGTDDIRKAAKYMEFLLSHVERVTKLK